MNPGGRIPRRGHSLPPETEWGWFATTAKARERTLFGSA